MLTGPPNLSEAHARGKRRTQDAESDLEHLVQAIRAGDPAAVERLYEVLQGGVRFLIVRWSAPDDVDDLVHDVLLASVEAIKSGRLREPGALLGYVGRVAKNLSATRFTASVKWSGLDAATNDAVATCEIQEERILRHERALLLHRALQELPSREREIITRCYVLDQTSEQICAEMHLTETQYRLRKWRAKVKISQMLNRAALDACPQQSGRQSVEQVWFGKNLAKAKST